MDGYSVKDAAVVLGIPERRVWELLARGVLAGAPEGPDGMIVYLQPRSGAASVAQAQDSGGATPEPTGAKANGNGGSQELSPFRELLTEFRNLTERYGQALLALGEARGEVAALRGRVELLEARMDLRLPSTPPPPTVAWEIPEFTPEAGMDLSAFEADASAADRAAAADFEEALAGEDEPAAEPMIDLDEEAILAEELLAEEEPLPEPIVDEMAAVDTAAEEPTLAEMEEVAPEAAALEAEIAAEAAIEAEPAADVEAEPEIEPEPTGALMPPEPEEAPEEHAVTPRRRARGGRTATAAFAAALARADDPTIAELPGAKETAAALAALQRDIDTTREEAPPDTEATPVGPEAVAEPEPEAAAEPEPEAAAEPAVIDEVAAVAATDQVSEEVPAAEAETPEPTPASVPSYYSTDVVEPDWFADGDFSWLEAAQAEGIRIAAEESQAREASTGTAPTVDQMSDEEETSDPEPQEAASEEPAGHDEAPEPMPEPAIPSAELEGGHDEAASDEEGSDLRPAAIDRDDEAMGVAADVAFGDHPDTDATQPDVGHDRFEPSVESQASAEEEARTAIQDAFDEANGGHEEESPIAVSPGAAVATAVGEPETEIESEAEPQADADMADEAGATLDEAEAAVEEPELIAYGREQHTGDEDVVAEVTDVRETDAIQEAFEPPDQLPDESIHDEHEAEVEAEAIQEAFDEPTPAPEWSAAVPEAEPRADADMGYGAEATLDEAESIDDSAIEEPQLIAYQQEEPTVAEDVVAEVAGVPETDAIQDAFEPPDQRPDESIHAEHEAEVEAEAIQEAFDEGTAVPQWSAAAPGATSAVDEQPPTTDDAPRASDDAPLTYAAAAATFHGPEEFIAPEKPEAPPAQVVGAAATPAAVQPLPTSGEEALMWLGEEFEEADLEVAAQGWRSPDAAPAAQAALAPVLELSDAELAQLAEDEGWDADEVDAIRRLLGRPSDAPPPELISPAAPASDAGPSASPSSSKPSRPSSEGSEGPPAPRVAPQSDLPANQTPPWSSPPPADMAGAGADQPPDPEWLQGRAGAAAEAYRRLRKLFPS
ncbi:MAG TPA: hypothetical protein VIH33_06805 [Candidatus Limnocylindria bacterium]